MPKCLECGFEAPRLQWTHFKYKCTGRFNNGKEYKQAHPGATLVDDELAKQCRVTEELMIKKHGVVEGKKKWEEYRQRQAYTNSYEYKQKKFGWSKDEFDRYNKSRSMTLENMISRYGEVNGTIKWQEYCERQAYTNTEAYFIEKYGQLAGKQKYQQINALKAHTIENVQRVHNVDYLDAVRILESRSTLGFSSNLELEIIDAIEEKIGTLQYTIKTKQYCVYGNNKANFYDIVHNNRAIEINGDYWHCNPVQYPTNYFHKQSGLLAEDIWQRDFEKIKLIQAKRGIPVLIIWESEYLNNPKETIEKCIKWMHNERK